MKDFIVLIITITGIFTSLYFIKNDFLLIIIQTLIFTWCISQWKE